METVWGSQEENSNIKVVVFPKNPHKNDHLRIGWFPPEARGAGKAHPVGFYWEKYGSKSHGGCTRCGLLLSWNVNLTRENQFLQLSITNDPPPCFSFMGGVVLQNRCFWSPWHASSPEISNQVTSRIIVPEIAASNEIIETILKDFVGWLHR